MEKRYLFRGKRSDTGEWVEWNMITGIPHDVHILDNTICQCTGVEDKNGKLIWEKDIVDGHIKRGAAFLNCLVLWNESKARFDVRAKGCNFPMTLDELQAIFGGLDYEVIGNTFDSPELLEV